MHAPRLGRQGRQENPLRDQDQHRALPNRYRGGGRVTDTIHPDATTVRE